MITSSRWTIGLFVAFCGIVSVGSAAEIPSLDEVLQAELERGGVDSEPLSPVDDLAYLRRVSVDLIGRIPTGAEIDEYMAWPKSVRRQEVVEKLLQHERFSDRWTAFYADLLRLRSNAEGGAALIAYVHNAVEEGMPYDELARRLISSGGKAGAVPEVGFILGDDADPMALAGITSQVFMGIRISCAQCHDHPFDKWTQKDFYGFAAYFGKTRRQERRINDRVLGVYTTELPQSTVMWPPEGAADTEKRQPMPPVFPISFVEEESRYRPLARLNQLRQKDEAPEPVASNEPSLDDLLAGAAKKAERQTDGSLGSLDVFDEAKNDVRGIDLKAAAYRNSELRAKLAELITDPRNPYFSRSFVNRVWAELVGRGFVEPIDDFSENNPATHPETLAFLADEFVANGFDLRKLVKMIVLSDAYRRSRADGLPEAERLALERNFQAAPMRRMISEVLYDSIITAGHLFEVKHPEGQNLKTVWKESRLTKKPSGNDSIDLAAIQTKPKTNAAMSKTMSGPQAMSSKQSGYDFEKAIEIDFDAVLADAKTEDAIEVEQMTVKTPEELEAERLANEMKRQRMGYVDVFTRAIVDDNPVYSTAMRMQSPAPDGHFVRVFGQTDRNELGAERDQSPTMRQALMILNGKLTNEAARVGELEPIYPYISGESPDLDSAIRLAYREILTRKPTKSDLENGREVIGFAETPKQGLADLRWVLLNSHEFRFLP
ncbi:DUF1553 domain-containing protein [Thalassoroseus pseudoceratinae]|uniref:DUF1553 domain-containing protein n=1 Tax=Thalassoroseus pseudoceratinae TaxID=2713176 RepID=UPI001421D529|nr:DUF1553 domain-containing protein [Thalassoroseus pseudoceratinae]